MIKIQVLNYTDYSNNSDPIPLPPKIYTTYFVPGTPAIPATPASSGVPATPRIDKTPDQSLSIEYLKKGTFVCFIFYSCFQCAVTRIN